MNGKAVERWQSVAMNLYRLDTGEFWMDEVGRNRQGTVSASVAESLLGNLKRDPRYKGETMKNLLCTYWGNGCGGDTWETLLAPFPTPGPVEVTFGQTVFLG